MKTKTKFLLSAVAEDAFPVSERAEVAFVGRSNVGKPSLVNALVGTRMARVSSKPGLTQAINFFEVDATPPRGRSQQIMVADLPGYGYARVSKKESRGWASFIDPYLSQRGLLKLVVVLVDSTIPVQPADQEMVQWLKDVGRPYLLVGTKSDKIGSSRRLFVLNRLASVFESRLLAVSATTGDGLDELWRIILAKCAR